MPEYLTFSQALNQIKKGAKLQRKGWNGKNMFIVLFRPPKNAKFDGMIIQPHIYMRTAQEEIQPGWLASQADLLAEDWQIVP